MHLGPCMAVRAVVGTHGTLQGVWKTTPETCGKQVENSLRMAHSGVKTHSQVFPKFLSTLDS
jgi:hypothetical protein